MEPEVAAFLKRILTSIGIVLFWMGINSTAGIMFGHAFVEGHITIGNIVFYLWFIISLPLVLWYLKKLWSKPIDFDN